MGSDRTVRELLLQLFSHTTCNVRTGSTHPPLLFLSYLGLPRLLALSFPLTSLVPLIRCQYLSQQEPQHSARIGRFLWKISPILNGICAQLLQRSENPDAHARPRGIDEIDEIDL